ncbi:MAG TPA: S-layer homology domain-containing protein, partial [Coleofasciculaceae cyanobacterium]
MRTNLAVLATILMVQAGIPDAFAQGTPSQADVQRERDQRIERPSPTVGDPVQKVVKAGLMQGFPDGQFHPENTLTRAQLATILVKAFQLDKRQPILLENSDLQDVPADYWAADA